MHKNYRHMLVALILIGIGAMSGYFISHPFGMPSGVLTYLYQLAHPLLGKFRERTYVDLGLAAFIYAIPTILVIGPAIGLILKRVHQKRVLVYSVLAWPFFYFVKNMVFIASIKHGENMTGQVAAASDFLGQRFGAEMSVYFFEYSLLFIIIFSVHLASLGATRITRRSTPTLGAG